MRMDETFFSPLSFKFRNDSASAATGNFSFLWTRRAGAGSGGIKVSGFRISTTSVPPKEDRVGLIRARRATPYAFSKVLRDRCSKFFFLFFPLYDRLILCIYPLMRFSQRSVRASARASSESFRNELRLLYATIMRGGLLPRIFV